MEQQPRRRRRPALSCIECRRRKIKCDRNDPCGHCVSVKTKCIYRVYDRDAAIGRGDPQRSSYEPESSPSGPVPTPATQNRRISTNQSIPRQDYHTSRSMLPSTLEVERNTPPGGLDRNQFQQRDQSQESTPDLRDLLQRIQKLEESSASYPLHGLAETGRGILARQNGLQDSQVFLNKTRMVTYSHWMGSSKEFAPIINCYFKATGSHHGDSFQDEDEETRALLVQMSELLQKCKVLARNIKLGRPIRCLSCSGTSLATPSRDTADKMVNLYFESFESVHRILHVPTFWIEYQRFWENPGTVSIDLRLKIYLAIAIGSSLSNLEDTDADFRDMVHQWIHVAQTWLSGPLKKDRLEVTGLQIHCLTILARQIFSVGGNLVWMSMGSLMHRAMQIGLHRDPKYLPSMSVLQAELRRRLWATILEMVVQSSLDSAMPPRISFDEFDTELPSNNNDDEMDESTTTLQPHPRDTYTTTSIQLVLMDSLPIRLRILQLLNGLHSQLSYVDVLALSSEITDAYQKCSNFMEKNTNFGVTAFHRNMLHYFVRRFIIPLHYPFAGQARSNPLFHYSLKASLEVSMDIISPEPDECFSHLMSVDGGLFREGIRLATTVIDLELIAQTEHQRLEGTIRHNSQYRDLLKQAVKDMIALSLERIRQGETNIKSHMFLRMILAHAEAIEAGTSPEYSIARSAVDSLELCHGLLQTQADKVSARHPNASGPPSTTFGGSQDGFGLDLDWDYFLPNASFS